MSEKHDVRSDEQQTIADAVQAVTDQQDADERPSTTGRTENDRSSGGSTGRSGHHPFTTLRPGTSRTGSATLQEVNQQIAEYVADQLTESVEWAVEETDPADSNEKE
jgi:hypothetical protein